MILSEKVFIVDIDKIMPTLIITTPGKRKVWASGVLCVFIYYYFYFFCLQGYSMSTQEKISPGEISQTKVLRQTHVQTWQNSFITSEAITCFEAWKSYMYLSKLRWLCSIKTCWHMALKLVNSLRSHRDGGSKWAIWGTLCTWPCSSIILSPGFVLAWSKFMPTRTLSTRIP